jgi:hypothetical protein
VNSGLKQLSYACGTLLALVVLGIGLLNGMPLSDALFRAVVVMCVGTAIVALFFRFFTRVLVHFLQEKVAEHQTKHAKERANEAAARRAAAPPPPRS